MNRRVEVVRTRDRFLELAPHWNDLVLRSGRDHLFLRHEWFGCVLAGFEPDPVIVLVWDGGHLVGAAPFRRQTAVIRGIPLRQLGLLIVPDTVDADLVLAEPVEAAFGAILEAICGPLRGEWDLLSLGQWPEHSPYRQRLGPVWERYGLYGYERTCSEVPVVPLAGSWADFVASRSVKFRKTHRNIVNRVSRRGVVAVERHAGPDAAGALAEAIEVSARSWKAAAGLAMGERPETRRFFEALTEVASRLGWLAIWMLRIDGRPIAMEYDLEYGRTAYALRADYDESAADVSPGSYLSYRIVERLLERGYREYNMGPGLNDYKRHWTQAVYRNREARLFSRKAKPLLAYLVDDALVPSLKAIPGLRRIGERCRRLLTGRP